MLVLVGLTVVLLVGASSTEADPAGRTTLSQTIPLPKAEGFQRLHAGRGEPYKLRQGPLGRAKSKRRAQRRRSLVYFGQFTDPQIADEMAPPRFDFIDEIGPPAQDGWRPQETLETQVFDQIIRNMNANRRSPVRGLRGRRARLRFVINTGDMADNQMLGEARNYIAILNGGRVDPFSGEPITDPNRCPGTSGETIARLNADVAARHYTGVQDYDDYRDAPAARQVNYWDPDEPPPGGGGPYADWPRYPGLLDRAQQPFTAQGLGVPWFTSRGNHDGEAVGNVPATFALARALATGCGKIFPGAALDPNYLAGRPDEEIIAEFANPEFQQKVLSQIRAVPPDSDRRFIAAEEFKALHGGGAAHGYGFVDRRELRASNGVAPYYAWSPRRGFRFISLDTVSDGGSQKGNLDNPQYKWLERELDRNSSVQFRGRRLARDRDPNRIVVLFGHHPLDDMTSRATDESAGACTGPVDPGCDRDPRRSTPIHRGLEGRNNLLGLLQRYPNVIALVVGHSHENRIRAYPRRDRRSGFWEINTASHVDWPQQSRLIEVMDNRDGTLSIFGTILDHAAPIAVPPFGTPAAEMTGSQLASISRVLAANDPQGKGLGKADAGEGKRKDRNVEMVIRNPKRFW